MKKIAKPETLDSNSNLNEIMEKEISAEIVGSVVH